MTEHQIELELEHFLVDQEERAKAQKGEEQYEDDGYEDYDKETDTKDDRLFWEPGGNGAVKKVEKKPIDLPKIPETKSDDGEWVDVEIDDDEEW